MDDHLVAAPSLTLSIAPSPDRARPFVGREREMKLLDGAVTRACDGLGSGVLLVGEAGIGKTRTAEEVARHAARRGMRVVWGRCHENAPPYWPWLQPLRELGVLGDGVGIDALPGAVADASDPEPARFRLFDTVAASLRAAAAGRALLLVIDDLHWADHTSLRLLAHLAHEVRQAPVLLLGTARPEEMRDAELARLEHVALGGLPDAEIVRLVTAVAGEGLPGAVAQAIQRSAEGNPFFALELLATLPPDGEAIRLPDHLRGVVERRFAPLPADTRRLLEAAAIIGRDFDLTTLARVADRAVAEVVATIDPAVAAGVVAEVPGEPHRRRFGHALLRDALDAGLAGAERARLHRRAGEVLAAIAQTPAAEVAHHFQHAAVLGDPGPAIEYGERAGRHALTQLAYEEAAGHFEAALALRPEDVAVRFRLLLALADAQWRMGDGRARGGFLDAAALARGGDARGFCTAVVGYAQTSYTETGTPDPQLHALLEEALRIVPPDTPSLRARLLARLASALYLVEGAEERRLALSAEALDCAHRSGDATTIAAALLARHTVRWVPGTTAERLALVDDVIACEARGADVSLVLRGLLQRVEDLLELGAVAAAERALAVLAQRAALARDPVAGWYAALFRANLAILGGRFADAERLAAEAFAIAPVREVSNAPQFLAMQLFFIRREQGRLAELEPQVEALAARFANLPVWRCGLLLLHLGLGRRERVAAELAALGADDFAGLPRDVNWIPSLVFCAEAAHAVGDARRAAVLFRLLAPHAAGAVAVGSGTACLGSVARAVALAATTAGDDDAAERHFEHAIAANAAMGAHPLRAHARHELAQLLVRRGRAGDRARAAALGRAARATAVELGMAALLAAIDAAPAAPAPRSTSVHAVLRPEGDYWTLSFDGDTCRLRDSKGLHYLAELLRRPGRPVHVAELVNVRDAGAAGVEWLDARAIRDYRARADALRDDIAEAEICNDVARASRGREELHAVVTALAQGLNGGRRRRAGSPVERARVNVVRRIAVVQRRLARALPALEHYFRTTISTGTFCVYTPDPRFPVRWDQ